MECIACPQVPVSWGELLDKLSILEIKHQRLGCPDARANVDREHALLSDLAVPALEIEGVEALFRQLKRVNVALWDIEDAIREQEADAQFGPGFIALARSVYMTNDRRAALKREINRLLQSELVEEKSYADVARLPSGRSAFINGTAH